MGGEKKQLVNIAYERDKTTPAIFDEMIGYLHRDVAKNMTAVKNHDMYMNEKYTVKVDLIRYKMTIKGRDMFYKATLKPDVVYYPCFSLGCSSNKLEVKPLDSCEMDDEE